jgi:hypothetical protein
MAPTAAQIKQLRLLQGFRSKPPTVAWYFRANWWVYACLSVLCVGAAILLAWDGWPVFSGFFAGLLTAAVVRDLRFFRLFVTGWPLSNEITDWAKVEALIANASATQPNTSCMDSSGKQADLISS